MLLLKNWKLLAHKLDFRNWWISCLNSQAYRLAFCLSFALSPLPKKPTRFYICVSLHPLLEHPSYRQFFLGLGEESWFPHPWGLNVVCDNLQENQVERVSPKTTAVLWCQGRKKSTTRAPLPGGDWLLVKLASRCQPGLSRSPLPSIYNSSCSPLQIPAFSHLPPPEIKQRAFILPGIF